MADLHLRPKLWQIAVLFHPNEEEEKQGKRSVILVPLETILAVDPTQATILAGRRIPEEFLEPTKLAQLEVAVRPFEAALPDHEYAGRAFLNPTLTLQSGSELSLPKNPNQSWVAGNQLFHTQVIDAPLATYTGADQLVQELVKRT